MGGLLREGVTLEKVVPPQNFILLGFRRAGGVQKACAKKLSARCSAPTNVRGTSGGGREVHRFQSEAMRHAPDRSMPSPEL